MKTKGIILIFSLWSYVVGNAQRYKDYRDYSQRDSILINYGEDSKVERLNIKNSLKLSNDYVGNYALGQWNDYKNLTLLEYGLEFKKIPVQFFLGNERGSIYNQSYNQVIFNVKIDFLKYVENLKSNLNLDHSIEKLNYDYSDKILQEEINKKINEELKTKLPLQKLDSLQQKMESMKAYESMINNPQEIEGIKQRRVILRELASGNRIQGINYDSLTNVQNEFDRKTREFNLNQKNPELNQYRTKYEEVLANKDKALDIKNRVEGRIQKIKNTFNLSDKLSLSRLKITKFNLGQTSVDNSELVFRGFMVNGIQAEIRSPFYFQAIYSLPFQTNFLSNYTINSAQNNKVQTLGGAVGTNPEKKYSAQIGYYRFKETEGSYSLRYKNLQLENEIALLNFTAKPFKNIQSKLEFAKSTTNQQGSTSLFSTQNLLDNLAIKWANEWDFAKTQTKIKFELQSIGLKYYSSANPFVQRGRGGLVSLDQKIGSKLQWKSKLSYRHGEDSSRMNTNLAAYTTVKYKLSRNTTLEGKANYFKNEIQFQSYYSNMTNEQYSLQAQQRFKRRKSVHNLILTGLYTKTTAQSSTELNNSGTYRNGIILLNYTYSREKLSINAISENNLSLDSSNHKWNNGINASYQIGIKTNISLGVNSRWNQTQAVQKGVNASVTSEIKNFSLIANLMLLDDQELHTTTLAPQLRLAYKFF